MHARPVSGQDLGKQRLRFWLRLLRATNFVEAQLRERLRVTFDTTLPRFDVLAALYRTGEGLKMSELSRMLMVSNGNVTGIIDRLVADDMVVRMPIEGDRRATRVGLTQQGRKDFSAMATAHESWINEILGALDEPEIAAALALLDKLKEARA